MFGIFRRRNRLTLAIAWFVIGAAAAVVSYVVVEGRPDRTFGDLADVTAIRPETQLEASSPETAAAVDQTGAVRQGADACIFAERSGTLWAPYLEWSMANPSYSGNPFDVVAQVTFLHAASGESRTTEMFYDGGGAWRFRFTATRTGEWTFTTSSSDPELDGCRGAIAVTANPDSAIRGFTVCRDNKFARQIGEDGELEGYLFNVFQDNIAFPADYWDSVNDRSLDYIRTYPAEQWTTEYLAAARAHGANTMFIALANQWLEVGALAHDEHSSVNPELLTFEMLERVIATAHAQGGHLHIWMWGDEQRKWSPVGLVGGINGAVDRRLQRYIAARLGPLPGWTMSYGFDLGEPDWIGTDTSQLTDWAAYLNDHMGWAHLLFARGYSLPALGGISYSSNGPGSPLGDIQTSPNGPADYDEVAADMNSNLNLPHLYEERFWYMRQSYGGPPWTMERTRRVMWWNTLAGGMGAWWGHHHSVGQRPYPNPEQLATHAQFWEERFLLGLTPANERTDGYAMRDAEHNNYLFYKEDAASIRMDLSGVNGSRRAYAVDTKLPYAEVDLGLLSPVSQTWTAPYVSDWAIAVGSFDDDALIPSDRVDRGEEYGMLPAILQLAENSIFLPVIRINPLTQCYQ